MEPFREVARGIVYYYTGAASSVEPFRELARGILFSYNGWLSGVEIFAAGILHGLRRYRALHLRLVTPARGKQLSSRMRSVGAATTFADQYAGARTATD